MLMMETLLLVMAVLAVVVVLILVLLQQVKEIMGDLEQGLLQRLRRVVEVVRMRLVLHFLVKLLVAVAQEHHRQFLGHQQPILVAVVEVEVGVHPMAVAVLAALASLLLKSPTLYLRHSLVV